MKKCIQCNEVKDLDSFYNKGARLHSYCKDCFNNYCAQRWIESKKKAIEYLGGKCCICGYSRYYGALDFHHLDPKQKEIEWTKMKLRSWDKIKHELDKCVCVCRVCHAEVHAGLVKINNSKAL